MVVDWNKGTVDFSQKSPQRALRKSRLDYRVRIVIAVGLFILALWWDYTFLTFSIVHEIGHALGAVFTGAGVKSINVYRVIHSGGNKFITSMAGPFFAIWFWLFVGNRLTWQFPELSTFFIGLATAELLIDMQATFQYADFSQWPNMRYLLLLCYILGVILYIIKLTGGLLKRTTKGS